VGTDLAWSVTALGGYRFPFSKRIMGNVVFGYRALHQDFESGGETQFKYDTTMHGPYVGVSIDFGQWPLIKLWLSSQSAESISQPGPDLGG